VRVTKCFVAAWVTLLVTVSARAEDKVPELLAGLGPVGGYLGATVEPDTQRFQVIAVEPEAMAPNGTHTVLVTGETLVRPGQTRQLVGRQGDLELKGSVTVEASGKVMYRATLYRGGQRIASSSASLELARPGQ